MKFKEAKKLMDKGYHISKGGSKYFSKIGNALFINHYDPYCGWIFFELDMELNEYPDNEDSGYLLDTRSKEEIENGVDIK